MGRLVDRAASLLQAHFSPGEPVTFTWLADGEECRYLARLEWPRDGMHGPRVVVLSARTGDVICTSQPGQPFEIDPASVDIGAGVAEDEIEAAVSGYGSRWPTAKGRRR